MKELHNHIFSNTVCISKKTMLKYINKQLSKSELHEVEKHLLDCEFCSDAFEGIKLTKNSSMIFAIDNKIDQRVRRGENNQPLMRSLMVAASILIIVFGAYFTFDYFDNAVQNQTEFTVVETTEKEDKEFQIHSEQPINNVIEVSSGKELKAVVAERKKETEDKFPNTIVVNDNEERIVEEDLSLKEEVVAGKIPVLQEETSSPYFEPVVEEMAQNDMIAPEEEIQPTFSADKTKKASRRISKKKSGKLKNIYTIHNYKVYDYTEEYQLKYELSRSAQSREAEVDYANEVEQKQSKSILEKTKVEVTYKEVLEQGFEHLKDDQYNQAKEQFNLILKTHPKDLNALFYEGMCLYRLKMFHEALPFFHQVIIDKNDVFKEEAKWYKALILIETDKIEGKKLLQEIIDDNGFYKNKAIDQLKVIE